MRSFQLCLSSDGLSCWSFGCGEHGQLGLGHCHSKNTPQSIEALQGKKLKKVVAGFSYSMFLTTRGKVHFANSCFFGHYCTSLDDMEYYLRIAWVMKPCHIDLIYIWWCVQSPGQLLSCGHERYIGRIDSNGSSSSSGTAASFNQRPQQIPFLESVVVVDVSCGEGFTIALTDCGVVFAWGNNTDDRLGLDTSVSC